MKFLSDFTSEFLDKIINRYSAEKNGGEVTEDDIDDLEDATTKAEFLIVLENFREEINENMIAGDTTLESIEVLIKKGSPIDRYLNTSLENEVQSQFDSTLHKDDGEIETRIELDQNNLDSASYSYSVLQGEFKRDIVELDDLIFNLIK